MSDFHKANVAKYRSAPQSQIASLDRLSNVEYINLFIESVSITNLETNSVTPVDLREYSVGDVEDILATFPQDVMYSDDGVIQRVATQYISRVNDAFDKHKCV